MEITNLKYKIVFCVILILLLGPMVRKSIFWKTANKLDGHYIPIEKPVFDIKNFLNRDFQEHAEIWIAENIGFRNMLVRLRNQLGWSLFRRGYAQDVVEGKEGYLFTRPYIDAVTGKDFLGMDSIDSLATKLKDLQDTLEKQSKTMLVLLAPGKASYSNKYLPKNIEIEPVGTNYNGFKYYLNQAGVRHINFRQWFEQMRDSITQPYPLFPKTGIHWSTYGATLAADSLIRYLDSHHTWKLPKFDYDPITLTTQSLKRDEDIGLALNLIWKPQPFPMGRGKIHYHESIGSKLPSVLIVGDSYWFGIAECELLNHVSRNLDFLYYNKKFFKNSLTDSATINTTQMNRDSLVRAYDILLFLATDANLDEFPWGFENVFTKTSALHPK